MDGQHSAGMCSGRALCAMGRCGDAATCSDFDMGQVTGITLDSVANAAEGPVAKWQTQRT